MNVSNEELCLALVNYTSGEMAAELILTPRPPEDEDPPLPFFRVIEDHK